MMRERREAVIRGVGAESDEESELESRAETPLARQVLETLPHH